MKSLKTLCALLLVAVMLTCFVSCDEFEKESYEETLDIVLETPPTSISALIPDIEEIVLALDPDGQLTQAMAVYSGDDEFNSRKGTLYYTYCSQDEENQRATIIIVTYDIATSTVTNLSYEEGNGLFVDADSEAVEETCIQITFDELFTALLADSSMSTKIATGTNIKLTIEFNSTGVELSIL